MTDPPSEAPPPRPRRRWLKRVGIALAGVASILFVAVAVAWIIIVEIPASRLPALVAALEAKGETLDLAALAPLPIPDDQNAAVLLQQAFEEMDRVQAEEQALVDRLQVEANRAGAGEVITHPTRAAFEAWCESKSADAEAVFRTHENALRAYVAARNAALELGEQALLRPACRFEQPEGSAEELVMHTFPHLAALRRVGRLFALRSFIRAVDGDTKGTVQDWERVIQVARTLRGEPFMINYLVRCGLDRAAVRATQRGLTVAMPAPNSLRACSRAFAEEAEDLTLVPVFHGERAYVYALSRYIVFAEPLEDVNLSSEERKDLQRNAERLRDSYLAQRFVSAIQYDSLLAMSRVIDTVALPYAEAIQVWQSFGDEHPKQLNAPWNLPKVLREVFTSVMLPSYAKTLEVQASTVAALRTAAVGGAIAADMTEGAAPPETLAGIPKPLRTDPFTGTDLRVTRTDDALVIYSIGVNGQDDGGVFKKQDRYRRTDIKDDIAFRVPLRVPAIP